jgi:hypothetical protein
MRVVQEPGGGECSKGQTLDVCLLLNDTQTRDVLPLFSIAICVCEEEGMAKGWCRLEKLERMRFLPWITARYWSNCCAASLSSAKGYGAPRRAAAARPEMVAISCVLISVQDPQK